MFAAGYSRCPPPPPTLVVRVPDARTKVCKTYSFPFTLTTTWNVAHRRSALQIYSFFPPSQMHPAKPFRSCVGIADKRVFFVHLLLFVTFGKTDMPSSELLRAARTLFHCRQNCMSCRWRCTWTYIHPATAAIFLGNNIISCKWWCRVWWVWDWEEHWCPRVSIFTSLLHLLLLERQRRLGRRPHTVRFPRTMSREKTFPLLSPGAGGINHAQQQRGEWALFLAHHHHGLPGRLFGRG